MILNKMWIVAFLLLLILGCKSEPKSVVLASVSDVELTLEDLRSSVPSDLFDSLKYEQKLEMIQSWVDRETLRQAAIEKGIHEIPKVKRQLQMNEQMILSEAFKQAEVEAFQEPTESDLKNYYRMNKKEYLRLKDSWDFLKISTKSGKSAWDLFKTASKGDIDKSLSWISKSNLYEISEFKVNRPEDKCLLAHLEKSSEKRLSVPKACNQVFHLVYIREKHLKGEPLFFDEVQKRVSGDYVNRQRAKIANEVIKKEKALRLIKVWTEPLK